MPIQQKRIDSRSASLNSGQQKSMAISPKNDSDDAVKLLAVPKRRSLWKYGDVMDQEKQNNDKTKDKEHQTAENNSLLARREAL